MLRASSPLDDSALAPKEPFHGALEFSPTQRLMAQQVHTYTELRKQIHDDLRVQHPEWVQPNGESPICDSYEVRLKELLADLEEIPSPRHARCARARRQVTLS